MDRPSFSYRTIFAALGVSLILAAIVAGYIYERHVRFVPTAAVHLPTNFQFAVRLDVEQAVVYEPFRTFMLPLIEKGWTGPESRAKALERATTLEVLIDAREFVYGELPEGEWIAIAGGMFRRDGVLSGVEAMMRAEGVELSRHPQGLVHRSGVAFGVSPNGNLLLTSSVGVLEGALSSAFGGPFGHNAEGASLHLEHKRGTEGALGFTLSVLPEDPFLLQFIPDPPEPPSNGLIEKVTKIPHLTSLVPLSGLSFSPGSAPSESLLASMSREDFGQSVRSLAFRVGASLEKSLENTP